ncbi:Hypothetical_protein [Hexamita inflata]|uniref:Hypothetical_protein n=1 Tax=Hexamita inflata TaxID=28002 RepID=A0AA86V4B0_9EUKA|nr:Hypothetical protein HINF_LOCUS49137 [Hexamita inflata]CAI9975956.1 Hypothetical protein HINF_LOCUS63601 [Hexamita inflata]
MQPLLIDITSQVVTVCQSGNVKQILEIQSENQDVTQKLKQILENLQFKALFDQATVLMICVPSQMYSKQLTSKITELLFNKKLHVHPSCVTRLFAKGMNTGLVADKSDNSLATVFEGELYKIDEFGQDIYIDPIFGIKSLLFYGTDTYNTKLKQVQGESTDSLLGMSIISSLNGFNDL